MIFLKGHINKRISERDDAGGDGELFVFHHRTITTMHVCTYYNRAQ